MSAVATAGAGGRALRIRGRAYPVLLPKLSDPRLHLATVFICLHTLGQVQFHFRVSMVQIAAAVLTCAILEVAITFWQKSVIMWPASAMLTGNGIAFILRVPGTEHGDWWSTHGLWIYIAVAAVSLLSKYLIRFRGRHVFNPSNLGLVLFFLVLGSTRTEPLEFWWGPTSPWLILVLGTIVTGALVILSRLKLLFVAAGFWLTFTAAIGVIAASGHAMSANWHVGPVTDGYFWRVLIFSPEVFIFLSFMITDPKTVPVSKAGRRVYAISIGLLSALLIAPQRSEFGAKVGLLGALTIVCAAVPIVTLLREWSARSSHDGRLAVIAARLRGPGPGRRAGMGAVALVATVIFAGLLVLAGHPARSSASVTTAGMTGALPQVTVGATEQIARIDSSTATRIGADVVADLRAQSEALQKRDATLASTGAGGAWLTSLRGQIAAAGDSIEVPAYSVQKIHLTLEPGVGQAAPTVLARLTGTVAAVTYAGSPATVVQQGTPAPFERTFELALRNGRFLIVRDHDAQRTAETPAATLAAPAGARQQGTAGFARLQLTDVAAGVGLDFEQGAFRYGVDAEDTPAMMGGGLCWIDYDNDGWLDLFAVNSYADRNIPGWQSHGGLPTSALFHNVRGTFTDVSKGSGAALAVRGSGCVAADFNGDGNTDLYVSTAVDDKLLWNDGDGTFTEGARKGGVVSFGWHAGAAVADVNGDGRPDLFVAGYTDVHQPYPTSMAGFPTNHKGVRDLLFVNRGNDAQGHAMFNEVGEQLGLDAKAEHGLGAIFTDVNGDGRPDLYVANDGDPNRLYVNEPSSSALGFRLVERGASEGLADPNAGMGIADSDYNGDGLPDLFVTNSRHQRHAVFASQRSAAGEASYLTAGAEFAAALGKRTTVGWGTSWVDLDNDSHPDLVIANGAIPVTDLEKDTEPVQVLQNLSGEGRPGQIDNASGIVAAGLPPIVGRGLAAADFDNDGKVDVAINSIGGPLVLLRNTGGTGNWLEVSLKGFHPGAVVTAVLPDGRELVREVHAGSSYLSSEDPRVHFGLGAARSVRELIIRYPDGMQVQRGAVDANQILAVEP